MHRIAHGTQQGTIGTEVYNNSGPWRVKSYVQFLVVLLDCGRWKRWCPQKGALGRLILTGALGFPRSVNLQSVSVTSSKASSMDCNGYPVISRLLGIVAPPSSVLSCMPSLEKISGLVDKVFWAHMQVDGSSGRRGPLVRDLWGPGRWGLLGTYVSHLVDQ